MNARTRILLGLAPEDEQAVEDTLYATPELRVLASGSDARELLELAATSQPDLVLLSAGLPGLNAGSLARLRALGPRLAGLALDERAAAALARLDLDEVVRTPAAAALLLPHDEPVPKPAPQPASAPPLQRRRSAREGSIVAVVGSRGAPGASELAASFAAVVAQHHRVLLAELDGDGGRLAAKLGADAHERSLLGPVRALAAGERDAAALLPHWLVEGGRGWPAVLLGFPDARSELAEGAAPGLTQALLDLLTSAFPLVVCDLGHRLAPGGERDLAVRLHREVALAADAVVAVLGVRPEQLHAGLAQLDLLLDELRIAPEALRVVVNGQPGAPSARPLDGAASLTHALTERGLTVDAWLPYDERALRASLRRRQPLALAARRGPYARALAGLVSLILLPSLPRPALRKRRLRPLPAAADTQRSGGEEVALPWRS